MDSFTLYKQDLSRYSYITREEEQELARRYGDSSLDNEERLNARQELIGSHIPFVFKIASNYFRTASMPFEDRVGAGTIGLVKAVDSFDPDRGVRFSTYAAWWIKQSIKRALLENIQPVHIPTYMVALINQWRHTTAELESTLGRTISVEEMAELYRKTATENFPPIIMAVVPANDTTITEGDSLKFSVAFMDEDDDRLFCTWTYDNTTISTDTTNSDSSSFVQYFPFGAVGSHSVEVSISDGELYVNKLWNITVLKKAPPKLMVHYMPWYQAPPVSSTTSNWIQVRRTTCGPPSPVL